MATKTTKKKLTIDKAQNLPAQHRAFQDHALRTHLYKRKRMKRNVEMYEDGAVLTIRNQEQILERRIPIHPEFSAYTFHLDGCPRKLLMYIIFYEVDLKTCRFNYGAHMIYRFHEYCSLFQTDRYKDDVVKQALKKLVESNIAISVERGKYMLNPLIAGGANEYSRKELINEYSRKLIEKGLDTSGDFYPQYERIA